MKKVKKAEQKGEKFIKIVDEGDGFGLTIKGFSVMGAVKALLFIKDKLIEDAVNNFHAGIMNDAAKNGKKK